MSPPPPRKGAHTILFAVSQAMLFLLLRVREHACVSLPLPSPAA